METQFNLKSLDRITRLPTIPVILFKVNEMFRDEDCSVKKLSGVIESDQALTAKILKLVNSAFYGFRSRIIDMPQALMILGFNTIRNAIVTVSVIDAFKIGENYEDFDIKDLWKHSVAVAITSKQLAERSHATPSDDAFVAGLLHDIGKIIIAQYFREHFGQIWKYMREEGVSFIEAERKLSFTHHDHGQIGGYLAEKWQFPQRLADAIRFHHNMSKDAADPWLMVSVYLANRIVNDKSLKLPIDHEFFSLYPEFSEVIEPCIGNLQDWFPDVEIEIENACKFFLESDEK